MRKNVVIALMLFTNEYSAHAHSLPSDFPQEIKSRNSVNQSTYDLINGLALSVLPPIVYQITFSRFFRDFGQAKPLATVTGCISLFLSSFYVVKWAKSSSQD